MEEKVVPEDGEVGVTLLPVRMLNEFVYCPRLFHFMNVEGRWADNYFTEEGRAAHRRVDALDNVLPDPTVASGGDPGDDSPDAVIGTGGDD